MVNTNNIDVKLQQEDEWLKSLQENLKKSETLRKEITVLLKSFEDRLEWLDQNVVPLYKTTAILQRKQTNIKKILKTVDAMQQFYGRAAELESSIREGNASVEREEYIERMEQLAEAISFFSAHPAYKNQLDNMKLTFESGCCVLEKEFRNVLSADSVVADAKTVVNCLDQDYEIITSRLNEIITMRNFENVSQIACWLLNRNSNGSVIHTYATIRGDNILKTLIAISQNDSFVVKQTAIVPKTSAASLKQAIRKATGRSSERFAILDWRACNDVIESILVLFGSFFALIQIEAEVMKKIIVDVSAEAKIQRELIVRPLRNVIDRSSRLLDENEYALIPLLPLLKHVNSHHNQLSSLADNANGQIPYQAFYNKLRSKCTSSLDEFLDRLASDSNKYVPDDGNVHQITSDTLNFLNGLLEYRQTVSQLLTTSSSNNSSHHLPRLFARILSALGLNLKNKAENYSDETLAAIFLLNNNNYIHSILQNDGMLSIVCEHNAQIHSFYRSEINLYKSKYLQSWNKVVATLLSDELIITDRHSIKAVILAFNAEFEKVVNTQKDYCITDLKLSCDIKNEVKNLVCEKYADFYARINRLQIFRGLEKHLKYTPQSLERVMDRLFVVSG